MGDLGCFGHPTSLTPNLDTMASEGAKLMQYYVAAVSNFMQYKHRNHASILITEKYAILFGIVLYCVTLGYMFSIKSLSHDRPTVSAPGKANTILQHRNLQGYDFVISPGSFLNDLLLLFI